MARLLYQVLLWLALPAVLIRLEWRAWREPEYGERIGERLGRVPAEVPPGCIWFHAVSAGETIAAAPLIAALAGEFSEDGGVPFLVTAMTPAGLAQAASRLGGAVHHCYAPYDFPFAVRAFFDRVRPKLLVLVETELWPNLIGEAHRRGVPVLLVNARLSERSARGYALMRGLTAKMLEQIGFVACQYDDDVARYKALDLGDAKVAAFGSVKFDAALPDDHVRRVATLRRELGLDGRRVWLAGSTHPGEDGLMLDAHAHVCDHYPQSCLLLVPRHPVRAAEICDLARRRGFAVRDMRSCAAGRVSGATGGGESAGCKPRALQSEIEWEISGATGGESADCEPGALQSEIEWEISGAVGGESAGSVRPAVGAAHKDVIVCDTMGQLQYLYGLSEIAFLGGSLVPVGGHNPIEAALYRQPLVTGPHTWNFADVFAAFAAAGCLTRAATAEQLAAAVIAAFQDEGTRAAAGARALQVIDDHRGATVRLLALLRNRIRAAIKQH